jgi:hypothetical protein
LSLSVIDTIGERGKYDYLLLSSNHEQGKVRQGKKQKAKNNSEKWDLWNIRVRLSLLFFPGILPSTCPIG